MRRTACATPPAGALLFANRSLRGVITSKYNWCNGGRSSWTRHTACATPPRRCMLVSADAMMHETEKSYYRSANLHKTDACVQAVQGAGDHQCRGARGAVRHPAAGALAALAASNHSKSISKPAF